MKVMTLFGYEIMLPRGFWFQTLDVNKPWRQIQADRLLFFCVCVHTFFFFWWPQGNTKRRNFVQINHVIERNFEAANSRITGTSSGQLYKLCLCPGVISHNMFCLTHVIMQVHPDNTRYHCHVHPAVWAPSASANTCSTPDAVIKRVEL